MINKETKICTKCKLEKFISEFYKSNLTKDGLRYWCKDCGREDNNRWKKTLKGIENSRRNRRIYVERHPQKIRNYKRIWKINNPEKRKLDRLKTKLKRTRELGFIPLNEKDDGDDGHHIDNIHVIYIPKEIHESCAYPNRKKHREIVIQKLKDMGCTKLLNLISVHIII